MKINRLEPVKKYLLCVLFLFFLGSVDMFLVPANAESYETADFFRLNIDLSANEMKWLEEHKTIRVSGPRSFPPFYFYNEEGLPQGIAADYIEILFGNLGVDMEVQSDLLWPEVLEKAENHELDLIACSAKSEEREGFLLFSAPHLSYPLVIISRNDSPFIGGLKDLYNLKVALIEKNIISDWLARDAVEVIPYLVGSPLEALEAVSVGTADAYIGNLATCSYLISQKGLTNLKVAAPTSFGNYNLYIAVRDDWPELVSILNKGLAAISPVQQTEINNSWLSIKYEYGIRPWDIIRSVLIVSFIALVILLVIFRWNRLLVEEIESRKQTEKELKKAFEDINTLTGLLPICSHCKNIRDDKGYWKKLEAYFEEHASVMFSHGLCPDCAKELYGKEVWFEEEDLLKK